MHRFARAFLIVLARWLDQRTRRTGNVTGSATGNRVQVTVEGVSIAVRRLATYTPVAGDVVAIDCSSPDGWLVLGKIA
jgi:hypothetical protein